MLSAVNFVSKADVCLQISDNVLHQSGKQFLRVSSRHTTLSTLESVQIVTLSLLVTAISAFCSACSNAGFSLTVTSASD
jgi:hypothetical protein